MIPSNKPTRATGPAPAALYVPPWMREMQKLNGLAEKPGAGSNPEVLKLYAEAGHPEIRSDEVAWCAAAVGAALKRSGWPNTGSLAARSYEAFPHLHRPMFGAIGVKRRGTSAWLGHVGIVVAATGKRVWMLGGNQHDRVCVAGPFNLDEFTAWVVPPKFDAKLLAPVPTTVPKWLVPGGKLPSGPVKED